MISAIRVIRGLAVLFPVSRRNCYGQRMSETRFPEAGDLIEVTTERLAYGGEAVARHQGLAIFVPLAAAGETLRVRVTEIKKNFARAAIEEILVPSPSRREALCRYFGDCGGCQLQHIEYRDQLAAKAGFVRDALARIGKLDWPHEIEIGAAAEFAYRARAQVKLERQESATGTEIRIGFSRAGSHSVCDVEECPILVPELNSALGSLRSLLSTSPEAADRVLAGRRFAEIEMAAGSSGVSFEPALGGLPGLSTSRIVGGAIYDFNASAFFQANPFLIEALVEESVGTTGGRLAVDLYAGVGLFTVPLARKFERVVGVESDAGAASFGRQNLAANGISNAEFHTGHVETALKDLIRTCAAASSRPDLVLLDPPRVGAAQAIARIVTLRPQRVSYVSCDPTTLARDLRNLVSAGYGLTRVTAFDMFPQTYHVETVAHLELR